MRQHKYPARLEVAPPEVDAVVVALCYSDDDDGDSILDSGAPGGGVQPGPVTFLLGGPAPPPGPHIQGRLFPAGTLDLSNWVMLTGMQTWPLYPLSL